MTFDHRALPVIEFVACPGPLRVGDYFINRSALYGGPPIFIVSPLTEPSDRHDDRRVIPVVRPLEVPEPADDDEVETMDAEVLTWTSPMCRTFRIGEVGTWFDHCGYARGVWHFESECCDNQVECVNDIAEASSKARHSAYLARGAK